MNHFFSRPLYEKYGLRTTVFSALAGGLLTGKVRSTGLHVARIYLMIPKYNDGIPEGSRFSTHSFMKKTVDSLQRKEGQEKIRKVRELSKLAKEGV